MHRALDWPRHFGHGTLEASTACDPRSADGRHLPQPPCRPWRPCRPLPSFWPSPSPHPWPARHASMAPSFRSFRQAPASWPWVGRSSSPPTRSRRPPSGLRSDPHRREGRIQERDPHVVHQDGSDLAQVEHQPGLLETSEVQGAGRIGNSEHWPTEGWTQAPRLGMFQITLGSLACSRPRAQRRRGAHEHPPPSATR